MRWKYIGLAAYLALAPAVPLPAVPAPTVVTASQGLSTSGVQVSCASVTGAGAYQAGRGNTLSEYGELNVTWQSAWAPQTQVEDATASPGVVYYYTMRAAAGSDGTDAGNWSESLSRGFRAIPLQEVQPQTDLTFASGGDAAWVGHYPPNDADVAFVNQSVPSGQSVWLETTVYGAGSLSFKWRSDCDLWDDLVCEVNGILLRGPIAGQSSWETCEVTLQAATNEIRWVYNNTPWGDSGAGWVWVKEVSWTPLSEQAVAAPEGVDASDGTLLEKTRVSWSAVSGATHYEVSRALSREGAKEVAVSWATGTEAFDTGGNPGTPYHYFVRAATNALGDAASAYSEPDSGYAGRRPSNDAFAAAQLLSGVYGGSTAADCTWGTPQAGEPVHGGFADATNSVWWSWTAPVSGLLMAEVRGSVSNFIPVLAAYTNAGTTVGTLVTITNGVPGTNGWTTVTFEAAAGATYWLAAAGRDGVGSPLELRWAVDGWLCPAPSNVSATDESLFERVRVTWDAVPEATHYEVWRVEAGVRPNAPKTRLCDWIAATVFDDEAANPGLTYLYFVRAATDASGWLAGPLSGSEQGSAGSRPWNDNLASAGAVTGAVGTVWGGNALATAESGEPPHAGFDDATNSVWWRWTAPSNAVYRFTTEGSDGGYDHVLAVYTNAAGSGVGALAPVAAAVRGEAAYAAVFVAAEAGATYFIAVAGREGSGGVVALNWEPRLPSPTDVRATDGTQLWLTRVTWDAVAGASVYEVSRATSADGEKIPLSGWTAELSYDDWEGELGVPYLYFVRAADAALLNVSDYSEADVGTAAGRPANDNRADAALLTETEGAVAANSLFATRESGEPQHAGFSDAGASLWWSWTAPVGAPVTFATGGDEPFVAVVAVYTNASGGALLPVTGSHSNGHAAFTFDAQAGSGYLVALAGRPNAGGPATVAWSYGDWTFPAPAEVVATDGTRLGEIGVTWSAVADAGVYEVSRADTAEGVRTVVRPWAAATAFVDTEAVPDQIYYYFVRAALDSDGTFAGAAGGPAAGRAASRPANDDRAQAATIPQEVFSVGGDVTWASAEPGEPDHGGSGATNSVWWLWTAPAAGSAMFDAGASACPAPVVAIYTNALSGGLAPVAGVYSNGLAAFAFTVHAGADYLIAVAGAEGAAGAVTLARAFVPAGPSGPTQVPVITGFERRSVGGQPGWRIRFIAEAGVGYEVVGAAALSAVTAWAPLVPPVAATASSDGEMTLDVPQGGAAAFFRIRSADGQ